MTQVITLAMKDMRLLLRNRGRIFFTFIWPIIVTVLFGLAFGGSGNGERGTPRQPDRIHRPDPGIRRRVGSDVLR
jgi:ABC-type transport system involved in cytochrome c biogenesis permease component